MSKRISSLIMACAIALAPISAMAQSNTNPGGGAKMNNAPSADAMSDKSSPAMKTPGMAAPMHKAKKHGRKHVKMHKATPMPQKSM